jgi:nitrite reductase/ring-hydroxylating ferredoxin subunit
MSRSSPNRSTSSPSSSPSSQGPFLDRRRVLGCAALLGVTGPLLVACGSDEEAPAPAAGSDTPSGEAGSASPSQSTGDGLVAAADVPVGGGVILADAKIVITQPTEGEFKAFSATCTHQGATLSGISGGRITCPLHGSQFAVEDGANLTGPNGSEGGSVAALAEIPVEVVGGQVVEA